MRNRPPGRRRPRARRPWCEGQERQSLRSVGAHLCRRLLVGAEVRSYAMTVAKSVRQIARPNTKVLIPEGAHSARLSGTVEDGHSLARHTCSARSESGDALASTPVPELRINLSYDPRPPPAEHPAQRLAPVLDGEPEPLAGARSGRTPREVTHSGRRDRADLTRRSRTAQGFAGVPDAVRPPKGATRCLCPLCPGLRRRRARSDRDRFPGLNGGDDRRAGAPDWSPDHRRPRWQGRVRRHLDRKPVTPHRTAGGRQPANFSRHW